MVLGVRFFGMLVLLLWMFYSPEFRSFALAAYMAIPGPDAIEAWRMARFVNKDIVFVNKDIVTMSIVVISPSNHNPGRPACPKCRRCMQGSTKLAPPSGPLRPNRQFGDLDI